MTEQKKAREVKGSGERVVLQAVTLPTSALKEAGFGSKDFPWPEGSVKDGGVTVWVTLGTVKADTRREAVNEAVPATATGRFRAPSATAWRGEIQRSRPTEVPLDETEVD